MSILVVSGTGTEVGKTVVTAGIAANQLRANRSVAVVKPVQTGVEGDEPGDLAEVQRLTGADALFEFERYSDPLAPAAAARLAHRPMADLKVAATRIQELAAQFDMVLVEGAGGLLVRFDDAPTTLADLASWLGAPILTVVHASLGTLNHTELTLAHMRSHGLASAGVVVGSWPTSPDLASRCNLRDLEAISGGRLRGVLPESAAQLGQFEFGQAAYEGLDQSLQGCFDAIAFRAKHDPT